MPKTLTVRYSELNSLAGCQLRYKLEYASGLTADPSMKMVQGSAFHELMRGHYESFRDADAQGQPRDLASARKRAGMRLSQYAKTREGQLHFNDEMLENLRYMYAGYIEVYGVDSELDLIQVIDEKRVVPLVTYKGVTVLLQCTADLVVRWNNPHGKVWLILDHKTMSGADASKSAFKKENQLDPQRKLYAASFSLQGERKSRLPIFAAYHNIIRADKLKRAMTLEERYSRTPVFYTEIELVNAWEEAQEIAKRAVEIQLGVGPKIYSSPEPMSCNYRCAHAQAHITANATGRDIVQVAIDYGAHRNPEWKPLAEREPKP